jgi:ElaB/YqjD/DUF883 family membrane-anchored ribosome-binding protein
MIADVQNARDAGRQLVSDAVEHASAKGRQFVQDNPGLALAGALGVGVRVGMALHDRL